MEELHRQRTIQVYVDVDERIAPMVEYLQTIDDVRTFASCEGGTTYGPYVMVCWNNDQALASLVSEFDMTILSAGYGCVHPRPGGWGF